MRIFAFADEACPQLEGQIAAMRRNGLQGLEVRGVDGTNVSDISLEKAEQVRKMLDDAGLITWSIGSPIGKINIETYVEREDENGEMVEVLEVVEFDYGELALHSTVKLSNLTVVSVYTTNTDTASKGALTITCKDANGKTIEIRTASKLIRDDDTVVVASDFPKGTVISVKGIIDLYNEYQVKVFNIDDITIEK